MNHLVIPHLWQRSRDGILRGVCAGLGKKFGLEPNLLRFLWCLSILLFGSGLLLYLILAFVLPREDQLREYQEPKILGVCYRYARFYKLDLALVRVLSVLVLFFSLGAGVILYVILSFIAPKENA